MMIEPENSEALANAIRYLAATPEIAQRLGKNGREYIVRNFSRRQTAEKYIRTLEGLLNLPAVRKAEIAA